MEPIPCPECGCTRWYDIVHGRETERIDFFSDTGSELSDSLRYEIDDAEGWVCADNDHPAGEQTNELIEAAR